MAFGLAAAISTAGCTAPRVHRVKPPACTIGPPRSLAQLLPGVAERVIPPKKKAWEQGLGGEEAARPHVRARLSGWPRRFLVNRGELPADDGGFARRLASDTWRGLEAFTDRENGLPVDHVRLALNPSGAVEGLVGDYASGATIGLHLIAIVAAYDLGLLARADAIARTGKILDTVDGLETYAGFLYNFYDTTSRERTSNFVSFVDASWLTAGLIVVRGSFAELGERCGRMIAQTSYQFFYDPERQEISHGYYVDPGVRSPFYYGMLYTEARLGSLIAIGKGDIPDVQWFRMARTLPADCPGQTQSPRGTRRRVVHGFEFSAGYYEWSGLRYVPSWGGSLFEALMPALVLDEAAHAPKSLGANDTVHTVVQQRYAREVLDYPVWGLSPSASPGVDGYAEYGVKVLGVRGYEAGAVTPHAAALALGPAPEAALANLRRLAERYDMYGEYGLYDAVDPRSGAVASEYLALDQAMLFIALANYLDDHAIQKRFATDPIVQRVLPMIGEENFFE